MEDPETVVVDVVDPTAEPDRPIEGARVVFFTKVADSAVDARYLTDIDACRLSLHDAPFEVLASATTDGSGRVVGKVQANATVRGVEERLPVYVAVDGPERFTSEIYVDDVGPPLPCGFQEIQRNRDAAGDQQVMAPVYPTRVSFGFKAEVGSTAAAQVQDVGPGRSVWWPKKINVTRDHLLRLDGVDAELRWSNGLGDGWADLFLAFGKTGEDEPSLKGTDDRQGPMDTENLEMLRRTGPGVLVWPGAAIGPVTDQPVLTADGISYRINGTLHFEGAAVDVDVDR